ncbi:MAG: hypothetical protein ACTSRS_13175 [Candidatus Helarchaeota archaeon]
MNSRENRPQTRIRFNIQRLFFIALIILGMLLGVLSYFSLLLSPQSLSFHTRVEGRTSFHSNAVSPYFNLIAPDGFDIEAQPLSIYGALSNLATEEGVLYFRQDFSDTLTGTTYVIFTFSTSIIPWDETYTFTLDWEFQVGTTVGGKVAMTQVMIDLWNFSRGSWAPIHILNGTEVDGMVDRAYGWNNYTFAHPFSDFINGDQIRVRFVLTHNLQVPLTWTQQLYFFYLVLEARHDVAVTTIQVSALNNPSPSWTSSGTLSSLKQLDATFFTFNRTITAPGESGTLLFNLTFDLGYYGLTELYGLRFSHLEWVRLFGDVIGNYLGRVWLVGKSKQFLCYFREFRNDPIVPDKLYATFPALGNWLVNGTITLQYELSYNIATSLGAKIELFLDWGAITAIRSPEPIFVHLPFNPTIYTLQSFQLEVTALNGLYPLTQIQILPWGDTLGFSEGIYQYSRMISQAGNVNISLYAEDSSGANYTIPLGTITVLPRPISIPIYLTEDPFHSEFIISLQIRDVLSNTPLALYPFTKTILKDGTFFREQSHQTSSDGSFTIHEPVAEYLGINYTVHVQTWATGTYAMADVWTSILLSNATPFITINQVSYPTPLKVDTPITISYSIICQAAIDQVWLYRNSSPLLSIPGGIGTFNYTFTGVQGVWQYSLRAVSMYGQMGYSTPFILNISALDTYLVCESQLDPNQHAIIFQIRLFDELNRSVVGIPLDITIHDFGAIAHFERITTGIDGIMLIYHFDQYLDHLFSIQIASESTELYKSALLSESGLSYEGYPLYTILEFGIALGITSLLLNFIRQKIRRPRRNRNG